MPETIYWGDIIFSLLGFILLLAVITTTVVLLAKFVFKNERGKEAKELNEKLDRIIWLLEKNHDDFQK